MTPASLFALPPELRTVMWELVLFDLEPRVCAIEDCFPVLYRPVTGTGSDAFFVYDYPKLRYVCHESRQLASYHSAALGWQVNSHEHPKRRFQAELDIVYNGLDAGRSFCQFLSQSIVYASQSNPNKPMPLATVQARQARHLALAYDSERTVRVMDCERLLLICPDHKINQISMVLGQVGREDNLDPNRYAFRNCTRLPKRPCKLASVPRALPIRTEPGDFPGPGRSLVYNQRLLIRRMYFRVKRQCLRFVETAKESAWYLRCRSLPEPQPPCSSSLSAGQPPKRGKSGRSPGVEVIANSTPLKPWTFGANQCPGCG
jgi:hypothetical protein